MVLKHALRRKINLKGCMQHSSGELKFIGCKQHSSGKLKFSSSQATLSYRVAVATNAHPALASQATFLSRVAVATDERSEGRDKLA